MKTEYQQQRRHVKTIEERIDYLTGRLVNCSGPSKSHHAREIAALKWALRKIEDLAAIESGTAAVHQAKATRHSGAIMAVLLAVALLFPGIPAHADDQCFSFAGQSNSIGCARTCELSMNARSIPPNVSYRRNGEPITNYRQCREFGPEVAFAALQAARHPTGNIKVVQFGVKGSGIDRWVPGGDLHRQLVTEIRAGCGGTPLTALFWTQGEKDAGARDTAKAYRENLELLASGLRDEFGNFPIYAATLGDGRLWSHIVQQAQMDAAITIPGYHPVSVLGIPKIHGSVHYGAEGQLQLGWRYFTTLHRGN